MSYFTYTLLHEFGLYCVNETATAVAPGAEPQPPPWQWSDDEIARVRVVLHRLTSLRVRNDEDAEDLVQETLLTVTRKRPDVELRKGLLIWSMGILRRKVGNYYRKSQRYTTLDPDGVRTGGGHIRSGPQESRLHLAELRSIIGAVLEEFPPQQRRAMELLLTGLPLHEIVQELFPERYQTVANYLYRGRKRLVQELSRLGYGPGGSVRQLQKSSLRLKKSA